MKKLLLILTVIAGAFVGGCTKYDNPAPQMEDYELPPDSIRTRKVLLLVVDGAVGNIVKEVMPTNIATLLPQSKYSFEAIADDHTSTPSSWATLMTGAGTSVHHIEDDSYVAKPSGHNHHGSVAYMPSFIFRLKETRETINILTFSRDLSMSNALMVDANVSEVLESDEEIKNEVVQVLNTRNPDLLVAQFQDVRNAGVSSAFSENSSAYVDAIQQTDAYIGEIMEALRARDNAEYEDWLVIITSNHGGVGNEHGGDSYTERNIFSIYHQPDLTGQELNAELMQSMRFWGHNSATQTQGIRAVDSDPESDDYFSLANHGEVTVEMVMRTRLRTIPFHSDFGPIDTYTYWYSPVVTKKSSTGGNRGWGFFTWNENMAFTIGDGTTNESIQTSRPNGDEWGILTGRIRKLSDGGVAFAIFRDGVLGQEMELPNFNTAEANDAAIEFIVGFRDNISYELPDFDLSRVRVWGKALTNQEINTAACTYDLNEHESLKDGILAEWKFLNANEGRVPNSVSGVDRDLSITGEGSMSFILNANYTPCEDRGATDNVLLQTVDVASQIFYWFGIEPQGSWGFQGQVFLSKFDLEFIK